QAFYLLHRLGDAELTATRQDRRGDDGRLGQLDCWATRSADGYQVLLSNAIPPGLADPAMPFDPTTQPAREVAVQLRGLASGSNVGRRAGLTEYRVDPDHANVLRTWNRLGRP